MQEGYWSLVDTVATYFENTWITLVNADTSNENIRDAVVINTNLSKGAMYITLPNYGFIRMKCARRLEDKVQVKLSIPSSSHFYENLMDGIHLFSYLQLHKMGEAYCVEATYSDKKLDGSNLTELINLVAGGFVYV